MEPVSQGMAAEIDRTRRRIAEMAEKTRELGALSDELKGRRFIGVSADETVCATMDGNGRLQDLYFSEGAIEKAYPERLGDKVVQAMRQARAQVLAETSARFAVILPEIFM